MTNVIRIELLLSHVDPAEKVFVLENIEELAVGRRIADDNDPKVVDVTTALRDLTSAKN